MSVTGRDREMAAQFRGFLVNAGWCPLDARAYDALELFRATARTEGEASGFRRGLEEAAQLMDEYYPNSQFDGYERAKMGHVESITLGDAIRSLASRSPQDEGGRG